MAFQEIICGPIVRRVEQKKVSIWIAFMKPTQLTLKIWEGDNIKHTGSDRLFNFTNTPPIAQKSDHAIQFGKNLYIALVTADIPNLGLETTKVYSYNIVFNETDSPVENDFLSDKLLKDGDTEGGRKQLAIGYAENVLPSFVLPGATPDKLVIAHGSCRKMHGYGQDALALLDDKIKDNLVALDKRPQALFLTGDQIYADEVPTILLRHLGIMDGTGLFASPITEKMRIKGTGPVEELEADVVNYPPFFRERLLNKYAGFSSQAAINHLISFEEFCGCYLNYWSGRSWHEDLVAYMKKIPGKDDATYDAKIKEVIDSFLDSIKVEDDPTLLTVIKDSSNIRKTNEFIFSDDTMTKADFNSSPPNDKLKAWIKEKQHILKDEIAQVKKFYDSLPKVSRLLANVATYMMMDDHEVTDDWNMTQRWRNEVLSKPFGRDIIRNAMMAYSIFQDWGNVPDEYLENANKPRSQFFTLIQEFCFRYAENQKLNSIRAEVTDIMENSLGMNANPTSIFWNYSLKCGPSQVIVLDTRTQRKYNSLNTIPELISSDSLLGQGPNLNHGQTPDALADNPPFVFIVSPCPVLGLSNFEELIQPAVTAIFGTIKNENNLGLIAGQLDFDFEAWAYNVDGIERFLNRLNNYKSVILLSGDVHFGATSVLDYWKGNANAPTSRIVQLISSGFKNEWIANSVVLKSSMVQKILTSFGESVSKLGWFNKIVTRNGEVTPRNRMRLLGTTAAIPVEGWTPGATLSPAPDFRWRLKLLKDERSLAGDPVTADVNLADANNTKEAYFNIVQRHQKMYKEAKTRRIAWNSNIGLLKFTADGPNWKLKHTLLGADLEVDVALSTPLAEQSKPILP
jgi:hypothetical protein